MTGIKNERLKRKKKERKKKKKKKKKAVPNKAVHVDFTPEQLHLEHFSHLFVSFLRLHWAWINFTLELLHDSHKSSLVIFVNLNNKGAAHALDIYAVSENQYNFAPTNSPFLTLYTYVLHWFIALQVYWNLSYVI